MDRIIGIGEYAITNGSEEKVKTFALSSCVALTLYCPSHKTAAMVHIALPELPGDELLLHSSPGYYAETAVPLLVDKMVARCGCSMRSLEVKLFGGADSINKNDYFNIGKKNLATVVNILDRMGISYDKTETGGSFSRTVELDAETGRTNVSKQPINF